MLGITGVALGVAGAASDGRTALFLLGGGTLLALGGTVFLQRVWSEPLHREGRWSAAGRRLATAVFATWAVGVGLSAVRAWGGPVPAVLGVVAAVAFAGTVVAVLAVAALDRPGDR